MQVRVRVNVTTYQRDLLEARKRSLVAIVTRIGARRRRDHSTDELAFIKVFTVGYGSKFKENKQEERSLLLLVSLGPKASGCTPAKAKTKG